MADRADGAKTTSNEFVFEIQQATQFKFKDVPTRDPSTYREGRPPLDRLHDDLTHERLNLIRHDHLVVCDQIGDLLGTLPPWQALWALQEVASAIITCQADGDDLEFSACLEWHRKALVEDAYSAHKSVQLELCQQAFSRTPFTRAPSEVYRAITKKESQ